MSKNVTEDGIGKALVFFCAKECLTLPHPIIRNTHWKNQADVAMVLWDRSAFDTHQPECVRHTHLDEIYFVHFCLLVYTWIGRGKKCVCPRYASTCLPHISYTTWQQTTRTLASAGHWLLSFWAFMGFPSFNDSTYKYQKKVFIFHLNIQNRSRISIINEKKQNYIAETFSSNREETPGRRLEDPTPPTASSGI